jgi:hypothetical protein
MPKRGEGLGRFHSPLECEEPGRLDKKCLGLISTLLCYSNIVIGGYSWAVGVEYCGSAVIMWSQSGSEAPTESELKSG